MPITIDESRTYFQTIMPGPRVIALQFHGQNHTLQSYLSFYGTNLFGLSFLSLRLGSVLGFLIYVLGSIRLSRICSNTKWLFFLTLLTLTINPVVLDFGVVARGYSLALAFFMVALGQCASRIARNQSTEKTRSTLIILSCLCSLTVLSNLSFAFATFSMLAVFVFWILLESRSWRRMVVDLLLVSVPGTVLFLLLNPAVFHFSMVTFYFGSASWWEFYESLTRIAFDSRNSRFNALPGVSLIRFLPLLLSLVVPAFVFLAFIPAIRNRKKMKEHAPNTRLWLFLSAVFSITVLIHSFFHWVMSRPLPQDRTGLFLLPLAVLIITSSITGLDAIKQASASSRILRQSSTILLGALVVSFLLNVRLVWVYVWKFDSGGPEVSTFVSNYASEHHVGHVGTQWPLDQALRFYPALRKDAYFPELQELSLPSDASRENLFVLHTRKSPFIEREKLRIIFEHPLSEVVVAVRQ